MKKIIFTLGILISALTTQAQTNVFHENFDAPTLGDSVASYSSNPGNTGWQLCSRLYTSPANSDSAWVGAGDTVILTTRGINLAGMSFVILEFDNICKSNFFDIATLEISPDSVNWDPFNACPPANNVIYSGAANFCGLGNSYNPASYGALWQPAADSAIADSSWWRHETFDISQYGNGTVWLRWIYYDSSTPTTIPLNGWKIDNINVTAAPCELNPPSVFQCGNVLQGTVYFLGPYDLCITATDYSNIATAYLYYTVNGVLDSVLMTNTSDSTFLGQIPPVNDSDTVCYYFVVTDGSCNNTVTTFPPTGCIQFIASSGITYPYCDNYDIQTNLWSDSSTSPGTLWEIGTPAFGLTTGAHTPPNAWDINLTTGYGPGANSYLYSPVLAPAVPNAKLDFWQNYNVENGWDGVRIEYTVDGANWDILGDVANTCACEVNWYNTAVLNSSGFPGWSGTSGGWQKVEYTFTNTFNGGNFGTQLQFRFIFTSDVTAEIDGYSFDDLCIALPQPEDAGVATILQPGNQGAAGDCVPIVVNLHNYGLNPLTSFNVFYSINGNPPSGPFAWSGNLAPGASEIDTLPCDTIPGGAFTLCAWTSFPTDGNHFNDTTCINSVGIPVLNLTTCDDLESGNIGYTTSATIASTVWQLGTPAYGATTGAHSGTNAWDINLTTPYDFGAEATLTTPIYDVGAAINPSFSFWQNRNVDLVNDGMRVEYTIDGGTNWFTLGIVNDPNGSNWYNNPSVNFSAFPGWSGNSNGWQKSSYYFQNVLITNPLYIQFRFIFTSGFPFPILDGISVDDICVTQPGPNDAGVAQILQPTGSGPAGVCLPIVVVLHNYGSAPLTSFNIFYSINGNPPAGPFAWTGNLAPGQTETDTLPCDTIPAGAFTLCSWTALTADSDLSNDTNCISSIGIPVLALTNCDDLENGNSGYLTSSTGTGTIWDLGTPAYGQTTGAHSGINAWDINLATPYTQGTTATLVTPIYDIGSGPAVNPAFSFWQNRNLELTNDGMTIEYTVDGGVSWFTLGIFGSLNAINWYNIASVDFSGIPGWSGNSGGWIKSTYFFQDVINANPLAQYIQFRFVFTSGFPFPLLDGISVDDICVTQPGPNDAGVTSFVSPGGGNNSGQPCLTTDTVQVVFFNYGSQPITQLNITWTLNGVPFSTTAWTGTIAPGAFSPPITLDTLITYPCGPFTLCAYTQLISDGDITNDTTCVDLIGIPTITLAFTNAYCDGFDSTNIGWTVQTVGAGSDWQLGPPNYGATSSPHSPPNAWDINLNTAYGNNAETYLYSPFFDFGNAVDTKLSFWVNYNTELNYDGVRLEYNKNNAGWLLLNPPDSTFNWYNMPNIFCSNQPAWAGNSANVLQNTIAGWAMVVDSGLGILNGSITQFRFVFCSDASVIVDGFSIDDFCLEVPVPLTVSPVTCENNASSAFLFPGQTLQFSTDIKNKGTTPITSAVACLYIDGSLIACDTVNYSPALLTNQFQSHTFSNSWVTTPGVHTDCIITSFPNQGTDQNPTDDTICCTISVIDTISVTSSPYCPDFESGPQWATMNSYNYGPNTSWILGTPNKGFMNAAHSGANAWVLGGLNTNYPNRDSSALFTPAFNIVAGRTYRLSFWHEFATETYQDGGDVEYTTDYGSTWQSLGTGGQANAPYWWYNSFFVTALGGIPPQSGWSGVLPVWQNPNHEICFHIQNGQTQYPVMFRFRFASDFSVNDLGWVIDDFCFEDLNISCPLTAIEEASAANGFTLGQNYPNPTNGMTSIDYTIPESGKVVLQITNLIGQDISTPVEQNEMAGKHTVSFDANKLSPGIYFYSLTFNKTTLVKKMVITK